MTGALDDGVLVGVDGVTLTLDNVVMKINRGFGELAAPLRPAEGLDWKTMIDLDRDGVFGEGNTVVGDLGHDDVVVAGGRPGVPIDMEESFFALGGDAVFNIFNFIVGAGRLDFAVQDVDVDLNGNGTATTAVRIWTPTDLDDARLSTLKLTVTSLFIGVPGATPADPDATDRIGFALTAGTIAIANLTPPSRRAARPTRAAGLRSPRRCRARAWSASRASCWTRRCCASTSTQAFCDGGGTACGATALNWDTSLRFGDAGAFGTNLKVPTLRPGAPRSPINVEFTQSGELLRVAGTMTLSILGFIHGAGSFVFEKGDPISITRVGESTPRMVSLARIGVSARHGIRRRRRPGRQRRARSASRSPA